MKKGGIYPCAAMNMMTENRSKASSPMYTDPKFMTVKVKTKGGKDQREKGK